MSKNNLMKSSFLSALGVVAYVVLFAFCVSNFEKAFGPQPFRWINIALFLILFIISACVTGSLVLLKPAMLYHDGKKKEALQMFAYTIGFLAVLALVTICSIASYPNNKSPLLVPMNGDAGQHCGGNMMNAPGCPAGYHCAPTPGSHLPFGDVGGTCVAD